MVLYATCCNCGSVYLCTQSKRMSLQVTLGADQNSSVLKSRAVPPYTCSTLCKKTGIASSVLGVGKCVTTLWSESLHFGFAVCCAVAVYVLYLCSVKSHQSGQIWPINFPTFTAAIKGNMWCLSGVYNHV